MKVSTNRWRAKDFTCIKGMLDSNNVDILVMVGDVVTLKEIQGGKILVEGTQGWCVGFELSFTPEQFVQHFSSNSL